MSVGLEGWLFAANEQEKRELIKQAIELHKYKGTPRRSPRTGNIILTRHDFRMV